MSYLQLNRTTASLSGGEAQRVRLAAQVGARLRGVLYVLDEPTIGLHQRDNGRLISLLRTLRDEGNSIVVVEHDEQTIRSADYVLDLGPGAGESGGYKVAEGPLDAVLAASGSLTAQYLRGEKAVPVPAGRRKAAGWLVIRKAREHNLKGIDVRIPLAAMTAVTGVSGSGKSTLVYDILFKTLENKLHKARQRVGAHDRMEGVDGLDKVVAVDQKPIGRTPRSNPATYTGLFTALRELMARTPEARMRGYSSGRFSFNVAGGRCEECEGAGVKRIEMHFLPDVFVTCDRCEGKRYNKETLAVTYKGRSIADYLAMTVDDAYEGRPSASS
jgi:excinuclease ABC subunit A